MPREPISIKSSPAFVNILRGPNGARIATETENGSAVSIPSDFSWGELWEIRASSALSNTQFQGLYMHIDTSVANTSSIRGAEISAKRSAAVAVGTLEGLNAAAYARTNGGGNITNMYGASGEVQVDSGYTGTISLLAGVRSKVQTEDGSTVSAINSGLTNGSFGFLAENEAVTGGKTMSAVLGAKSTGITNGFGALIDARGTQTTVHDTDQVTLFVFQDDQGTVVTCSYDRSGGGLVFA